MKRYPLAHKIIIPPGTARVRLDVTNVAATIKREQKRLKANETCKTVKLPPLVVVDPLVWDGVPDTRGQDLGRFNCQGAYVYPLKRSKP